MTECTVCGRNDVVTDEEDVPRCSRHVNTQRSYEVDVIISLTIDGDDEAAWQQVNKIMQAAWDRYHESFEPGQSGWDFAMLEGVVNDVTKDVEDRG